MVEKAHEPLIHVLFDIEFYVLRRQIWKINRIAAGNMARLAVWLLVEVNVKSYFG